MAEEKVLVICAGKRNNSGKARMMFARADEMDTMFTVKATVCRGYRLGGIYEIGEEGNTVRFPRAHAAYRKNYDDVDRIAKWQIAEDRAEIELRNTRQHKDKTAAVEGAMELLKPFRELYRTTDRTGRLALEVTILEYLRR